MQLVRVPASSHSSPLAKYHWRSTSPSRQMPPPTKKAHRQSLPSGEGGLARCTRRAYSRGFSFIVFASRDSLPVLCVFYPF